jgi:four helix bundle protein
MFQFCFMSKFKQLRVWQNSIELDSIIQDSLKTLPDNFYMSIKDQVKRSSISISSNIAEGSGRGTDKDYVRFLRIALSSSYELESQLALLKNSSNLDCSNHESKLSEIQRQLRALIKYLNSPETK